MSAKDQAGSPLPGGPTPTTKTCRYHPKKRFLGAPDRWGPRGGVDFGSMLFGYAIS